MSSRFSKIVGVADILIGLVALALIWSALPARWWPVDVFGTLLALAHIIGGGCILAGVSHARTSVRRIAWVTMILGMIVSTVLVVTASNLWGLYGPIGTGGAVLLGVVALLVLPYLVGYPAIKISFMSDLPEPESGPARSSD